MWLINVHSCKLEFFNDEENPLYAILSHTWARRGQGEEVLFADMKTPASQMDARSSKQKTRSFVKLDNACKRAAIDGLSYVWIDNCCINKESSAELSEAINSMWRYYLNAQICYAHLSDVLNGHVERFCSANGRPGKISALERNSGPKSGADESYLVYTESLIKDCQWFTRGWTLQELIAPREIMFFGADWEFLGFKSSLRPVLSRVTKIEEAVLKDSSALRQTSIAARMSWASKRRTTRIEDQAYSLMGLFDINMPMLYGEGSKAFLRLQEEIIRVSTDHSIFVWEPSTVDDRGRLLAPSPSHFSRSGTVRQGNTDSEKDDSFQITNKGLSIRLPTIRCKADLGKGQAEDMLLVYLNCESQRGGRETLRLLPRTPVDRGRMQHFTGNSRRALFCSVDRRNPSRALRSSSASWKREVDFRDQQDIQLIISRGPGN